MVLNGWFEVVWWGAESLGDIHSGLTPLGREPSAARMLVDKVLMSTNASILRILAVGILLTGKVGG